MQIVNTAKITKHDGLKIVLELTSEDIATLKEELEYFGFANTPPATSHLLDVVNASLDF